MSQPYDRIFNFSAGPSMLPVEVLEQAKDGILNYNGTGMSVMEMSHRSKAFEAILDTAVADLKTLIGIPDSYKVLFLQGGASLQFTMLALGFLKPEKPADFVVTGSWGKKALEASKMVGSARAVWDGKPENYRDIPDFSTLEFDPNASFVHITSNETIQGVEFQSDPVVKAPLIADMSSNFLSKPIDATKYSMIYAGAQKNVGPSGVTIAIVHEDLLATAPEKTHPMLDYRIQVENGSMYNTPNCWGIYICGLVFKYLLKNGGLAGAKTRNDEKAKVVYDAIDASGGFFKGHAATAVRSNMNVTFTLPSDDLTKVFVKEAEALKLDGLKGHRSVGGCRASIYNAFPLDGAKALAEFMKAFAAKNG